MGFTCWHRMFVVICVFECVGGRHHGRAGMECKGDGLSMPLALETLPEILHVTG